MDWFVRVFELCGVVVIGSVKRSARMDAKPLLAVKSGFAFMAESIARCINGSCCNTPGCRMRDRAIIRACEAAVNSLDTKNGSSPPIGINGLLNARTSPVRGFPKAQRSNSPSLHPLNSVYPCCSCIRRCISFRCRVSRLNRSASNLCKAICLHAVGSAWRAVARRAVSAAPARAAASAAGEACPTLIIGLCICSYAPGK